MIHRCFGMSFVVWTEAEHLIQQNGAVIFP